MIINKKLSFDLIKRGNILIKSKNFSNNLYLYTNFFKFIYRKKPIIKKNKKFLKKIIINKFKFYSKNLNLKKKRFKFNLKFRRIRNLFISKLKKIVLEKKKFIEGEILNLSLLPLGFFVIQNIGLSYNYTTFGFLKIRNYKLFLIARKLEKKAYELYQLKQYEALTTKRLIETQFGVLLVEEMGFNVYLSENVLKGVLSHFHLIEIKKNYIKATNIKRVKKYIYNKQFNKKIQDNLLVNVMNLKQIDCSVFPLNLTNFFFSINLKKKKLKLFEKKFKRAKKRIIKIKKNKKFFKKFYKIKKKILFKRLLFKRLLKQVYLFNFKKNQQLENNKRKLQKFKYINVYLYMRLLLVRRIKNIAFEKFKKINNKKLNVIIKFLLLKAKKIKKIYKLMKLLKKKKIKLIKFKINKAKIVFKKLNNIDKKIKSINGFIYKL